MNDASIGAKIDAKKDAKDATTEKDANAVGAVADASADAAADVVVASGFSISDFENISPANLEFEGLIISGVGLNFCKSNLCNRVPVCT